MDKDVVVAELRPVRATATICVCVCILHSLFAGSLVTLKLFHLINTYIHLFANQISRHQRAVVRRRRRHPDEAKQFIQLIGIPSPSLVHESKTEKKDAEETPKRKKKKSSSIERMHQT